MSYASQMAAPTPSIPAPPAAELEQLDAAWERFFASLRRARGQAARRTPADGDLTLAQYHLLVPLLDAPELPVGELALLAGVAPPTATRALDALVGRGLAERTASEADRRCVIVRLTDEGGRAVRRRRAVVRRKRAALMETLEPAEREQAERLLHRLADLIDTL
jgi:DNA-binding MarR family transcriptional regulator